MVYRSRVTHPTARAESLHGACNCAHSNTARCAACRPCAGLWPGCPSAARRSSRRSSGRLSWYAAAAAPTRPPHRAAPSPTPCATRRRTTLGAGEQHLPTLGVPNNSRTLFTGVGFQTLLTITTESLGGKLTNRVMAKKKGAPPAKPAADSRPVNQRGVLWQAEKLTGNRAQRGNLPGGTPRWTYEVKWKGAHNNTYEPADCLVGWEADMQEVDAECTRRALLPKVNPLVEAQKRRETAVR
eukprot:2222449-Prymnesium_polylepis.1